MSATTEWRRLLTLVAEKRFDEAKALLANEPGLRTAVNGIGETVLHYQAVENDHEGVSWLWNQGFDINTRNDSGVPVVFVVALLDYRELLNWFIAIGADLKCQDRDGNTIEEYVLDFGNDEVAKYLQSLKV